MQNSIQQTRIEQKRKKKFHAETLREPSTVMKFQQQLRKEFEKTENERAVEEEIHLEE
jgi:hypothetical protein